MLPEPPSFLSPQDFARVSGLSVSTVHRYLAGGHLPKFQPGGKRCRILIPLTALEQFQNATSIQREQQPAPSDDAAPQPDNRSLSKGPKPKWTKRC
ncbi:MAG: helix-turn-helix domain-containing protein [Planctomycetales bacterium]|nr:helix-turn-helix domain-containing protein [Planctomycetales bacterium]